RKQFLPLEPTKPYIVLQNLLPNNSTLSQRFYRSLLFHKGHLQYVSRVKNYWCTNQYGSCRTLSLSLFCKALDGIRQRQSADSPNPRNCSLYRPIPRTKEHSKRHLHTRILLSRFSL